MAGLLGFLSGSAALVGFAAGWALVLGLAWIAARRGLRGLEVRRHLPPSAFEGDLLTVDIENHAAPAEDHFGAGLADRQSVLEPGPLPPLHRRILSYRAFVARQWGLYTVGPLTIGRFDPLGLFFAGRRLERLDPFEVYPRAAKIEAVALLGGRASVAARDVTAAAAGQSLLFRGVRDFQAGDDVRRIHWLATARRGSPMVRENERDLQPVFTLFLDLERRGRAGLGRKSTLEYLVRVGSSLLWTAHRRGDARPGGRVRPAARRAAGPGRGPPRRGAPRARARSRPAPAAHRGGGAAPELTPPGRRGSASPTRDPTRPRDRPLRASARAFVIVIARSPSLRWPALPRRGESRAAASGLRLAACCQRRYCPTTPEESLRPTS
jgi:uncharacterized protein (DUF58 family)